MIAKKGFTFIEITVAIALSGLILSVVVQFVSVGLKSISSGSQERHLENQIDNLVRNISDDINYWGFVNIDAASTSFDKITFSNSNGSFCRYYYQSNNIYYEKNIVVGDSLFPLDHPKYNSAGAHSSVMVSGISPGDFTLKFFDKSSGTNIGYHNLDTDTGVVEVSVSKNYTERAGSYHVSKRIVVYSQGANNSLLIGNWNGAEDMGFNQMQNGKVYMYTNPNDLNLVWDDAMVPLLFNSFNAPTPFSGAAIHRNRIDLASNVFYDNESGLNGWLVSGNNDEYCRYIGLFESKNNCPTYAVMSLPDSLSANDALFFNLEVGHPDNSGRNPISIVSANVTGNLRPGWHQIGMPLSVGDCSYDREDYNVRIRLLDESDPSKYYSFKNTGDSSVSIIDGITQNTEVKTSTFLAAKYTSTAITNYHDLNYLIDGVSPVFNFSHASTSSTFNFELELNASVPSKNDNSNDFYEIKSFWIKHFNLTLNRGMCWGLYFDDDLVLNKAVDYLERNIVGGGGAKEYVMARYISPVISAPSGKGISRIEIEDESIASSGITVVTNIFFDNAYDSFYLDGSFKVYEFSNIVTNDFTVEVCQQQSIGGDPPTFNFDWSLKKAKVIFE